jgi:hypothetical protein
MVVAKPRTSCRSVFKKLEILPVPCQYIFSLMNFTLNNQEHFQTNLFVHTVNTRNWPNASLSCCQKSAFCVGIKIFNNLPFSFTSLRKEKAQFKVTLRRHLNIYSFHSVD